MCIFRSCYIYCEPLDLFSFEIEVEVDPNLSVDDMIETLKGQIYSITDVLPEKQQMNPPFKPILQRYLQAAGTTTTATTQELPNDVHFDLSLAPVRVSAEVAFAVQSLPWPSACTRIWIDAIKTSQPCGFVKDKPVCTACANTCFQRQEVTAKPSPDSLQFACFCSEVSQCCLFESRVSSRAEVLVDPFKEALRQVLARAYLQQSSATRQATQRDMQRRIDSYAGQVLDFENPENQAKARSKIPLKDLEDKARAKLNSSTYTRDELLRQLLHWFKHSFFKWVNAPGCESCGKSTKAIGGAKPNAEEARYGAGIVEIYKCSQCSALTRFPRYNHSGKLMETQRGRCGEWAQAFTLCCRALGFEARFVVDWTDHVWTEAFSHEKGMFVHLDPCEDRFDAPLLYEGGWGKKLTYAIAFSAEEIRDVTRRYTNKYDEVTSRRVQCSEEWLGKYLSEMTRRRLHQLPQARQNLINNRWQHEFASISNTGTTNIGRSGKSEELPGRQTGSLEWRRARGELGGTSAKPEAPSKQGDASSSVPEKHVLDKDALKDAVKKYFIQLTKGCGNEKCQNTEFCSSAKGPDKVLTPTEALKTGVRFARDHGLKALCEVHRQGSTIAAPKAATSK